MNKLPNYMHEAFFKLERNALNQLDDEGIFSKKEMQDMFQLGFYEALGLIKDQIKARQEMDAIFKKGSVKQ